MGKYDAFLKEVNNLPVKEVVGKRIPLRKKGSLLEGLCPFHNDKHYGNFIVDPRKNKWKCYACGESGKAAYFVSKFDGVSLFYASVTLGTEYGICSPQEAEDMLKGKQIEISGRRIIHTLPPENKPRDFSHCSQVYDSFVAATGPLTEEHKKHLMEVRHVDGWEDDFFEWPNPGNPAFWRRFGEELRKRGIHEGVVSAIQFVPGFAFNLENMKPYFLRGEGIGIKLHNANGKTSGLQIRIDNPSKKESKYKLFSSSWAQWNHEDNPRSFDGASAGQVVDILYPIDGTPVAAAVTEGKFKAIQLAKRGYIVLSVNGVNNWGLVLPEFIAAVKSFSIRDVHIFFDSDITEKIGVASAGIQLSAAIRDAKLNSWFITWNPELGKGIDDMLFAGHHDKLKRRKGEVMEKRLQNFINEKKSGVSEKLG